MWPSIASFLQQGLCLPACFTLCRQRDIENLQNSRRQCELSDKLFPIIFAGETERITLFSWEHTWSHLIFAETLMFPLCSMTPNNSIQVSGSMNVGGKSDKKTQVSHMLLSSHNKRAFQILAVKSWLQGSNEACGPIHTTSSASSILRWIQRSNSVQTGAGKGEFWLKPGFILS